MAHQTISPSAPSNNTSAISEKVISFGQPLSGRLILGDSIDIMKHIPTGKIDLVVTDPPYLVNYVDRLGRRIANDRTSEWITPAFAEIYRILKPNSFCMSFYGWNRADKFLASWRRCGFQVVAHFVFAKQYASNRRFVKYCHESAYLLAKGNPLLPVSPPSDVLPWQYTGNPLHPTQKPLSALKPIIEAFSKPGDIIFDPFAGSGSTLVAAYQLKRRFLGIELDDNYFDIAQKRLHSMVIDRASTNT